MFVDGGTAVTFPSMDTVVSRGFLRSKVIGQGQGDDNYLSAKEQDKPKR